MMIQRRNMWKQVLLLVITLGIYSIYCFYVTSKEMVAYKKLDGSPGLWTLLLFVPVANLYSYWKHSKAVESVTDGKYQAILIFILWIFFAPAVWVLTQIEFNRLADLEEQRETQEEGQEPIQTEST